MYGWLVVMIWFGVKRYSEVFLGNLVIGVECISYFVSKGVERVFCEVD